jgi:hypothetical protein
MKSESTRPRHGDLSHRHAGLPHKNGWDPHKPGESPALQTHEGSELRFDGFGYFVVGEDTHDAIDVRFSCA